MKVSIIIPVYNVERYLGECLDSILGQTLKDIEVICVDDGSTDDSRKVLNEYAARDARVRIALQEHRGAAAARNLGMEMVRGEYFVFCDGDDVIDAEMMSDMYARAKSCDADIVASAMAWWDDETRVDYRVFHIPARVLALKQPIAPEALGENLFVSFRPCANNKLFRSEFIRSAELVFQDLPRVNDLAFVMSATAVAKRIAAINCVYYHYRRNRPGNLTSRATEMPEMGALAWLEVKRRLEERGLYGSFRRPFVLAASKTLVNTVLEMTDAAKVTDYFARLRSELLPRFGFAAEELGEDANPLVDDCGALGLFMRRLSQEKASHIKTIVRLDMLRRKSLFRIAAGRLKSAAFKLFRVRKGGGV